MPEVWNGQAEELVAAEEEGFIEPSTGAGGVGKLSWYIPYFTAKGDYFTGKLDLLLLSYLGLSDDDELANRRRLAETFLRPQTWKRFCEEISADNCTSPYYDKEDRLIALRPPTDESEVGRYFVADLFHGHFAPTEENDCDKSPSTCTGHIADVPCDWTTYITAQKHWLKIPVKSSGPEPSGGYCKS